MWNAVMDWNPAEIQVYIGCLRSQLKDKSLRPWFLRRIVCARKPEASE